MDFVAWLSQASCMDPTLPCCYLSTFYCSRTDVHSPVLLAVIYTHRIVARDVDSYHRKATASEWKQIVSKEGTWRRDVVPCRTSQGSYKNQRRGRLGWGLPYGFCRQTSSDKQQHRASRLQTPSGCLWFALVTWDRGRMCWICERRVPRLWMAGLMGSSLSLSLTEA